MSKTRLLFFFVILGLCACVDEIELPKADHPDSGMLVQGKLLHGRPGLVTASVFELYTQSNDLPRPIGGASVVLQDDQGRELALISNYDGDFYRSLNPDDPSFPIQTGSRYRLFVSLPDGQKFQSEWEMLLPVASPDSAQVVFVQRDVPDNQGQLRPVPFARFGVSTHATAPGAAAPSRFRWELGQAYKITDTPPDPNAVKTCYTIRALLADNILLLNGTAAGQNYLTNYFLTETPIDYRFAEGYYLIVYQQSLSENAFGYFEELNQLLAKKGTLFDPPAGAIRTNISNPDQPGALTYGFFYAAAQDTVRVYVSPEMAGNPRRYCPLPPISGEAPRPSPCDDCLLDGGAQLEKPDWWLF